MESSNDKEQLRATKQRKILDRLVGDLSRSDPRIYYLSTVEVAQLIESKLKTDAGLTQAEQALMDGLGLRDIQILLSIHSS